MPVKTVIWSQDLDGVNTSPLPTVQWPPDSRMSPADKAAVERYTRDVQRVIDLQAAAIRELQEVLGARLAQ